MQVNSNYSMNGVPYETRHKQDNIPSYSVKPKSIDFTGFDDIYLPQNKSRE